MSTIYAHGGTGSFGVQGYATGASVPTAWVTLAVKNWKATITKAEENTSNTSVPGYTCIQPGKSTAKITMEAQLPLATNGTTYDQTHNPISVTGPDLQADYATVALVGGTTPAGYATTATPGSVNVLLSCPSIVISSFEISNVESDVISYTISGTSNGVFTMNGGS
jgi:hypothetical protein